MRGIFLPSLILVLGGVCLADDGSDRANLVGTWQPQDHSGAIWTIESSGGQVHLTETENDRKVADFTCSAGSPCDVREPGSGVKISMWYNGPKLVVQETRGSKISRHRFHTVDNNTMEVEIVSIVPEGKTVVNRYARRTQSAGVKQ